MSKLSKCKISNMDYYSISFLRRFSFHCSVVTNVLAILLHFILSYASFFPSMSCSVDNRICWCWQSWQIHGHRDSCCNGGCGYRLYLRLGGWGSNIVLHSSQAPVARLFQPLCYSKAEGACYAVYDHVRHIWSSISTVPANCYQSCVYSFTIVVMTVLGYSIHFWLTCHGHHCKKAEGKNIHLTALVTKKLKKSV